MYLAYPASFHALHSNTQKQIIQIQHNRIKNPNWQRATTWLFTSIAKNLNSGEPRTNPASGSHPGPPDCESDMLTTRPCCLLAPPPYPIIQVTCHKRTITQFTSSLSSGWSTGLATGGASEFETSRTKGVSYLPRKERKHYSNS